MITISAFVITITWRRASHEVVHADKLIKAKLPLHPGPILMALFGTTDIPYYI